MLIPHVVDFVYVLYSYYLRFQTAYSYNCNCLKGHSGFRGMLLLLECVFHTFVSIEKRTIDWKKTHDAEDGAMLYAGADEAEDGDDDDERSDDDQQDGGRVEQIGVVRHH